MNKRSVKKARPAKASARSAVRKAPVRKSSARQAVRKREVSSIVNMTTVTVAEVVARTTSALRSHKYRVGQTVFYTSSPISRPGASGSYQVVRLLPSDGDDYQYRIKNPGEAFERVAQESQPEAEPVEDWSLRNRRVILCVASVSVGWGDGRRRFRDGELGAALVDRGWIRGRARCHLCCGAYRAADERGAGRHRRARCTGRWRDDMGAARQSS